MIVDYHNSIKCQTALITDRGTKWMTLVMIDDTGLIRKKVPLTEERHMKPLKLKGKDYPLKRAINRYRKAGRNLGASKTALRELRKLEETL